MMSPQVRARHEDTEATIPIKIAIGQVSVSYSGIKEEMFIFRKNTRSIPAKKSHHI